MGLLERDAFLQAEPLLSLFGAGASDIGWIHGRLDVGTALPAEPAEPVVMTGTPGRHHPGPDPHQGSRRGGAGSGGARPRGEPPA